MVDDLPNEAADFIRAVQAGGSYYLTQEAVTAAAEAFYYVYSTATKAEGDQSWDDLPPLLKHAYMELVMPAVSAAVPHIVAKEQERATETAAPSTFPCDGPCTHLWCSERLWNAYRDVWRWWTEAITGEKDK